ncbi:DNA polymerase III subunit gamma and tau [Nocardioides nanhaiensis]|uniref:DNA polymerase III subunit gamma/tau n=1 Tax=Nocardioides nanhaiensis TaxID=1476871 RepID=A0ABP8WDJ0_9ACTN
MESPLALYRRYRPETFAEVIGQEHVTTPLRAALAANRVNHAYLFSGPRGCGKTTSARILARALNCELAPVADPCGQCDSCRDLARGGPGSIDVIEIDAASHGGVDDARDLREKAFFAPVRSRYKVYIIDEAHMVTTQGFNALLKLVEEPPPHLRFVFATTEPEKVIATIRSRTHHYPFRLIPPRLLTDYLGQLCEAEGVSIEPAALPLVVRAGAGSARDTLSVLDQLLGGAGPEGVTYDLASGLLGYTPDTLLDEVVDAFAAGDGAAVFGVVDKIIETGQDPRRFTEDLLRRLRDLVIVAAVPDAPATGLIDVAQDAGERLVAQAARFGRADLSRAADLVATGLTEMRGATAPRLLLELICARVLLPGADHTTQGVQARLDRLERRSAITGTPSAAAAEQAAPAPAPAAPAPAAAAPAPPAPVQDRAAPEQPEPVPVRVEHEREAEPAGPHAPPPPAPADQAPPRISSSPPISSTPPAASPPPAAPQPSPEERPVPDPAAAGPAPSPTPSPAPSAPAASTTAGGSGLGLVDVRRLWPDVIAATEQRRRLTWIALRTQCQVVGLNGNVLTLGFGNGGARESFDRNGSGEIVRQAVIDVMGADWRIETIVDPGADPEAAPPPAARPAAPMTPEAPAAPAAPAPTSPGTAEAPPAWADREPPPDDEAPSEEPSPGSATGSATSSATSSAAAREAISPTRTRSEHDAGGGTARPDWAAADADARPDDLDADHDSLAGPELLARELGAEVIEEIPHQ